MVKNYLALARLGGVSQARISQILSLLHLAPDIQEAILFRSRPERGRDRLDMRKVLPLTKVVDWGRQRRLCAGCPKYASKHETNEADSILRRWPRARPRGPSGGTLRL